MKKSDNKNTETSKLTVELSKESKTKKTVKKEDSKTAQPTHSPISLTIEEQRYLEHHQTLRLQIELVPLRCFWSNVRSNVKKSQWDKIRRAVYQKANNVCEICGGIGTRHPVECHEVWIYDETTLTQRLNHFQSICPLCHEVKHIGRAGSLGNIERARNRFKEINGLDDITEDKIYLAVWRQWRIRSKQNWKLDIEHLREWGLNPDELGETRERLT